jgi:L-fucose mutarotase/ribose pyranase (RbsD/FucU family)
MTEPPLFDPFGMVRFWSGLVLPGWHFGDVIVNEANSSAPETERRILAQESYGRQIGKLMDAVCALIELQGGPDKSPAFRELVELRDRVETLKATPVDAEVAEICRGLERLKARDPQRYAKTVQALRALLGD